MSNSTTTATSQSVQQSLSSSISSAIASATSSIASSVSSDILSDSTTTVEPSSTSVVTSVVSASSVAASTELITSVVTQTPTVAGETSLAPVTVVVTSVSEATTAAAAAADSSSTTSAAASSTSSSAASLQNNGTSTSGSAGLSSAGKTAIAVVVPVVVVALLVLAGLFFWRKRKQRKNAEEARRKEVEEYGFNPNSDPTLPAVAADGSEMAEDHSSGYRGWGNTNMSNRKASTTISGGHTQGQLSDSGSNPAYSSSPNGGAGSDTQSGDALVHNRDTMNSDDLGALGAAPVAGSNKQDIRRGPSNASSSYSLGQRSDHSEPIGQAYSSDPYNPAATYGFNQPGPYGDGSYGGADGMPVVRDVSARRNTRIEHGGGYQKGNSGIAQNF